MKHSAKTSVLKFVTPVVILLLGLPNTAYANSSKTADIPTSSNAVSSMPKLVTDQDASVILSRNIVHEPIPSRTGLGQIIRISYDIEAVPHDPRPALHMMNTTAVLFDSAPRFSTHNLRLNILTERMKAPPSTGSKDSPVLMRSHAQIKEGEPSK